MKALLLACLSVWCGVLHGLGALAADRLELSLPKEANLKEVFDAGLRPWRVSGLEKRMCDIRQSSLSISVAGRGPFDFEVQRGTIHLLQDNVISSIKLTGRSEPIPKAVARIKEICRITGMSSAGLDSIAQSLGNMPDPDKRWFNTTRFDNVSVSVTFYPMFALLGTTEAEVWLSVKWHQPAGTMKFLTEPIKPPPGYESETMSPPSSDPKRRPVMNTEGPSAKPPPPLPTVQQTPNVRPETQANWWLWWVAGAALIIIVINPAMR